MTSEESFGSWVVAARAGADWAWQAIYHEFAPKVLRYLRARGSPAPEDTLGEVFLQVVRRLHQFEGGRDQFRAWILTIARNRLIDEARRSKRRPEEPTDERTIAEALPPGDAEEDALRLLATKRVRSVLAGLPPDQRDVLLLRILGELSIEEVARALGKSPGAVKSLQARALGALRRRIAKEAVSL